LPQSKARTTALERPHRLPSLVAGVLATVAFIALDTGRQVPSLAPLLYVIGGSFLLAEAGFLGAVLAAWARTRPVDSNQPESPSAAARAGSRGVGTKLKERVSAARNGTWSLDLANETLSLLLTMALCVGATVALIKGWQVKEPTNLAALSWIVGILVAAVFPLVAAERHFAVSNPALPESAMLAAMCRLLIFTLLGLAAASACNWLGFDWLALLIRHVIAIVICLVALELFVRSLVRWYASPVAQAERLSHADSGIAGMLRFQWPDMAALSVTVTRQVGFDLGRSWALGFVRRALLPASGALIVLGWLLSGVSALGLSERAVYESLGRPVAVLHPGLHVHLPWPLGVLRPIEFGEVREVPIAFPAEDGAPAETPTALSPTDTDIEGIPPPSVDRLWDASHPSEASYLVASIANGRQNFEVINIDLRVMYRIGLSDQDAQQAAYNVASPEEVIRAAAGQMLARYFARLTVLDVLGENRESFIRGFQTQLQSRLASLSTGIEIMGVVVEAIHPPPAAAPAYQGVQTAAIRSVTHIAEARAEAVQTMNSAQSEATTLHNEATAAAAERVGAAKTELALFDGDRQAHRIGGPAFLLERRLQRFNQVLRRTRFTIVDHRIEKANAPLLDLRPAPYSPDTFSAPPEPDDR
jgi:regulator of protease activity HflC (stomatin/prohibitin superfamily)